MVSMVSMVALSALLSAYPAAASPTAAPRADAVDETLLLFVGEDLEMLSLASRREESAWQAPAVADVIGSSDIRERGFRNLGQVLEAVPGFSIAQKEDGYKPYLRGTQDSVLFLYDTVPLGLESDKSFNPLGYNLSLASVKRIEIIRGSGSVLWGPDAYAGIVNIVPMTGRDLNGVETGVTAGGPDLASGVFLNAGHDFGTWSTFFSLDLKEGRLDDRICNISRFWGDGTKPVAPELRYQTTVVDHSRYMDLSFRLDHLENFSLVGRLSDATEAYSISDEDRNYVWKEKKETPSYLVKAEGSKKIGINTSVRFTGYLTGTTIDHKIIDNTFEQEEETAFVELLVDRTCFDSAGLYTLGVSFRKKEITDVPVWESYLPDFIGEDNLTLLPTTSQEDIEGNLYSVFGQYRHSLGRFDLSAGIRFDGHDLYEDSVSLNAGAVWNPVKDWIFKFLVGTAYRTPFVAQMAEGETLEPEQVTSVNLQGVFKPSERNRIALTLFGNRIENHVLEDIFAGAGLSTPNSQDIFGVEFSIDFAPLKTVELSSSLTLLHNSGPDETYLFKEFTYQDGDGNTVNVYSELNYGYDPGSRSLFNLSARWSPLESLTLSAGLRYFSSMDLYYLSDNETLSSSGAWVADANLGLRDLLGTGLDVDISIRNLFDKAYDIPGTYAEIRGEPFTIMCVVKKRW